jgi:hypothetical protein
MNAAKKLSAAVIAIVITVASHADTLELADGRLLEGSFVGSSNGIIMFNTGESIEAFPQDEVVGMWFSDGVETAEAFEEENASTVTIPAGTRLVIRLTDNIDSNRHGAGHRFRGQLEGALVVNGNQAVPRGTFVHGRVIQAQQAGRMAGSSELSIEFTDLMLDDVLVPIVTGDLTAQTAGEGGRTVGRTARAAALGGLISGSSGARTGARVGAGASILTRGASINVPRGTVVETVLRESVRVQM